MSSAAAENTREQSAFAPFTHKAFAVIWIATVLSNIGTWMHDVGAGWLMTNLNPSPMMVALVQTATTLPVFLFALPAGALADLMDRRRLLLAAQTILAALAVCLGFMVYAGQISPVLLLLFTFLMGTFSAFSTPAWQAITPSLVPRNVLNSAVSLNSVGINISRAIGPALAGVILVQVGLAAPFMVNALSFLVVIAALWWWTPPKKAERTLPAEDILGAMWTGVRYARNSRPFKNTVLRAVGFFLFASAYWALLPLVTKKNLGGGSELYGILLGSVGAGAVLGALMLPKVRTRLKADHVVLLGTVGTAISLGLFAVTAQSFVAVAASIIAGASWIGVLTTLNVSAQTSLPDWVRARGLSLFVMAFFGSQTLGSLLWGQLASRTTISIALLVAAAGLLLAVPLFWGFKLHQEKTADLTPSAHWPEPVLAHKVELDRGPVMITVEYIIDVKKKTEFVAVMDSLSSERRRDGAYSWGIFEDTEKPGRFLEYFLVASWLEHLRQHERVTKSAHDVQMEARRFHVLLEEPVVSHFVSP
ncbi:MFS transporter [Bdellovibrio bacteriovorus]|uniref:MFS transporter n=1 Tax=Bdellovibrio bacteriovorus TaxID=959 RepID=UPI003AA827D4